MCVCKTAHSIKQIEGTEGEGKEGKFKILGQIGEFFFQLKILHCIFALYCTVLHSITPKC